MSEPSQNPATPEKPKSPSQQIVELSRTASTLESQVTSLRRLEGLATKRANNAEKELTTQKQLVTSLQKELKETKEKLSDQTGFTETWEETYTTLFGQLPEEEQPPTNDDLTKEVGKIRAHIEEWRAVYDQYFEDKLGPAALSQHLRDWTEKQNRLQQNLDRLTGERNKLREENNRLSVAPVRVKPCNHQPILDQQSGQITALKNVAHQAEDLLKQYLAVRDRIYQHISATPPGVLPEPQEFERIVKQYITDTRDDLSEAEISAENWRRLGQRLTNEENPTAATIHAVASEILEKVGSMERMSITGSPSQDTIRAIWEGLPAGFRNGRPQPQTVDDLNIHLGDYVARLREEGSAACQHPPQLARVLGERTDQDWETSLGQVAELMNQPTTVTTVGGRLFKTKDVPKFTDTKEYEGYRSTLMTFLNAEDHPAPDAYARALTRILASFEDPIARNTAQGMAASDYVRATWKETVDAFFDGLDDKFESATALETAIHEFMKVKPKDGESAADFFNRFEAALTRRKAMERRRGMIPTSDPTAVMRLLAIVPRYLIDHLRLQTAAAGEILENKSLAQIRPLLEVAWAYVPPPYKPPTKNANVRLMPGTQNPRLPAGANFTKPRQCGLVVSYDDQPPVPQNLRGSIYPSQRNPPEVNAANEQRKQQAIRAGVCEYCRRPADQHRTVGAQHKPIGTPHARPAPANVVPEERRLPAPPPRE